MGESAKQTIGDRLRIFREYKKLTQAQFAALMDMSTTGLQSNESNRSLPNSKLFIALYEQGLNVNWLLSGEGKMLVDRQTITAGNLNLFADAMEVIDLYLEKSGKTLTPEKKRKAVETLYRLSEGKSTIDTLVAEMIMQLAA